MKDVIKVNLRYMANYNGWYLVSALTADQEIDGDTIDTHYPEIAEQFEGSNLPKISYEYCNEDGEFLEDDFNAAAKAELLDEIKGIFPNTETMSITFDRNSS